MPKFRVTGPVVAGTYVGEYEAATKEEAMEKAWKDAVVNVCHQCAHEIEDPEITELHVSLIEERAGVADA